jgi:DNA-binding ferritin-like protein (Dps family)
METMYRDAEQDRDAWKAHQERTKDLKKKAEARVKELEAPLTSSAFTELAEQARSHRLVKQVPSGDDVYYCRSCSADLPCAFDAALSSMETMYRDAEADRRWFDELLGSSEALRVKTLERVKELEAERNRLATELTECLDAKADWRESEARVKELEAEAERLKGFETSAQRWTEQYGDATARVKELEAKADGLAAWAHRAEARARELEAQLTSSAFTSRRIPPDVVARLIKAETRGERAEARVRGLEACLRGMVNVSPQSYGWYQSAARAILTGEWVVSPGTSHD